MCRDDALRRSVVGLAEISCSKIQEIIQYHGLHQRSSVEIIASLIIIVQSSFKLFFKEEDFDYACEDFCQQLIRENLRDIEEEKHG